jgi:hypothetical protein
VTEKEASLKDWDMDFSVRLEEKSMLTSKIDLTDQACCRCTKTELCLEDSSSKREKTMTRLTPVIEDIIPVFMKTTRTTMTI